MVTEEELQNMSPEEIADIQKQQCIFCHIISGKVASKKIYEDDICLAILDINPANPGHILVLPKEHYQIMPQVPEETIAHLFMVVKHLSQAALKALKVEGVNILIANGVAAGQKAPHFMIHIIPRTKDDGLKFIVPQKKVSDSDLKVLHDNVKQRINAVFGIEKEEPVVLDPEPEQIVEKAEMVEADFEAEVKEEAEETQEETSEEGQEPVDKPETTEAEGTVEQVESKLSELDTLLGGEQNSDKEDNKNEEEDNGEEEQVQGAIDLDQIAGLF